MRIRTARTRRVLLGAIAPLLAGLPGWAWGAPQGAHVVAGSAIVSSAGNTLLVRQSSNRAIINWTNFSIGASETVQFVLPSASSAVLNRVTSLTPSELNGTLESNGIVYLINPNGILIGPHGQIDVHSFIGSTLDVSNQAFLAGGDLLFSGESTAAVVNRGVISTPGGDVVFIARQVGNSGQISAAGGSVNFAGGSEVLLQEAGTPGITVRVMGGAGSAANSGIIQTTIAQLTANGGNAMALAINNTGIIRATGVSNVSGHIYLSAGGTGEIASNGTLDASSATGQGGQIVVTGQDILIGSQSRLSAAGATGGGEILVGGSWENDDPTVAQAVGVMVQPGATLDASATRSGDGGTIVVRSDVTNPDSSTSVYGTLLADAAGVGNGGRIETSGYSLETTGATVSAAAPDGEAGEWLLDPYNLTISSTATSGFNTSGNPWVPTTSGGNVQASAVASALEGGSNVTISTGSSGSDLGNITDNAAIAKTSGSSAVTLELEASNNITINQSISSTSGALNLIFDAHQGTSGAIVLGANLTTNGGYVEFGTGRTSGGALVGGDVYFNGASAQTISTSGGTVTVNGQILIANPDGLTITSGGANIAFEGTVDSGDSYSLVSTSVTWDAALVDAKGSTGGGAAIGDTYLATITSSLENTIASNAAGYAAVWLGGHRVLGIGTNAVWRWVTGPEGLESGGNGLPFFTSNFTGGGGTAINGAYTNWNGGEPNNSGGANVNTNGESALQFLGSNALWNDLSESSGTLPYLVETNLAPSALTVNAGAGHVTFNGFVGGNKALASLTVTGAAAMNGGGVTTTGAQTYNNPVALGAGSTILTVTSGNLNIASNISYSGSSAASLSLIASGDVTISTNTALSASGSGALNVTLDSDSADTNATGSGQIHLLSGSSISSNGGAIVLGGGTVPGSDPAIGDVSSTDGIYLDSTTLNALGGDITVNGQGYSGGGIGLEVRDQPLDNNGTTIETSGIGTISITATGIGGSDGFFMQEPNHLIQTHDGDINITASSSGAAIDWVRQTTGSGPNPIVEATGLGNVTVTTTSGGVSLNAATLLTVNGNLTINSAGGIAMLWAATVDSLGSGAVSLTSSGGEIQCGWGTGYIIGGTGPVTLTANSMDFSDGYDGPQTNLIQGSGTLLIKPYTAATTIGIGNGTPGTLILNSVDIDSIAAGFSSITIGSAAGSYPIYVSSAMFNAPLTIRTPDGFGAIIVTGTLQTGSGSSSGSITLQAGQDIILLGGSITTQNAAITLDADSNADQQGNIQLVSAAVSSNGGAITLGGGADPATTPAYGNNGQSLDINCSGVFINSSTVESAGGNISIRGDGCTAGTTDDAAGVTIEYGSSIDSGTGTVTVVGVGAIGGANGNMGVDIRPQDSSASGNYSNASGINSDSTSANAIVITGTGSTSGASNSAGVTLQNGSSITADGIGGGITINGTGGTYADNSSPGNQGINLDADTTISAAYGNVTLNANSPSGIAAINNYNSGTRTISAGGNLILNPGNDGADLDSSEIIASGLLLTGPGPFTLTDASNSIATIAGDVTAGSVQVTDSTGLIVGSVGGTTGLTDTTGNVTLVATGTTSDITLDDSVSGGGSGSTVVLAAGRNFINDAGGSAIDAGSGRFLVYSTTPVDSVLDGLNGGEIYDSTYTGNPPSGITASGNQFLYSIAPTLTFTATDETKVYSQADPTLTYTVTGLVGTDSIGEAVSGSPLLSTLATSSSGVGNYTIDIGSNTLSSLLGYALHFDDGNLSVTAAPLTITADNQTKVYGAALPTLTASYTGLVNSDGAGAISGLILSTYATAASNVGSYSIAASGATAANYSITFDSGTLAITKAPLTITANDQSKVYGAALPTLTASYTGLVNEDTSSAISGLTLSTPALASSSVGTYSIAPSGATSGNYTITLDPGTLTITKAPLTITANDQSKVYGAALPTLTASYTGLVNEDTSSAISGLSLSTTALASSNVGGYGITASGATSGNYTITLDPGTLTITKAPLTITADNQTKVYGAALPTLTASYTGLVNEDTSSAISGLTLSTPALASSNVGTYSIAPSGATAGNYNITFDSGTLAITEAPLTITANDQSKVYGAALPTLTASYTGLVNEDTSSAISGLALSTAAVASSSVGTYSIAPSGATSGNYSITFDSGTLAITKAPLTITANDQSKVYGAALPTLTASYTGLISEDTPSAISGLVLSTPAMASSNVGGYAITASGATSGNYNITLDPGTLTITKAPLTITANDQSKIYGASLPTLTAGYTGLVNEDGPSAVSGLSLSTTALASSNAGGYAITALGATSGNYNITFDPGTLTITKAPLTITANDQSKIYGAALPTLTASYAGLVNEDAPSAISGLSLSTTALASSNVGAYGITASGAASGNYNITLDPGTLTITKAALTIAADDQTKVYGAALPTLTASYTGLVNGDGAGAISGLSLSTPALASSNVGMYGIAASGATSGNYNITLIPGAMTIIQAPLVISADDKIRDADQPNPTLAATYLGLVNGDQPSSISGLTLATPADATSPIGMYPIEISGAANGNYSITMVGGMLDVLNGFTQGLRDQWQSSASLGPNFTPVSITQPNVMPQAQSDVPSVIATAGFDNSNGNIFYEDRPTRGKPNQAVIHMGADRIVLNTVVHVSSFDQPIAQDQSKIADIEGQ